MTSSFGPLDKQLAAHAKKLVEDVGLSADEALKVATHCAADVRFLPLEAKSQFVAASAVPIAKRHEELAAFQSWMNELSKQRRSGPAVRAQVIVQNYVCFAYLKDACFDVLHRLAPPSSVAARCAKYLCSGELRDFRNAFAHADWHYRSDHEALVCWVLNKPNKPELGRRQFEVSQDQLNFWQMLSRGVAYAAYTSLKA